MLTVADIMTTDVVTVSPDTTVREAALTMVRHGISGLPVLDAAGALVGIVSEADFVAEEAVHDGAARPRLLDVLFGHGGDAIVPSEHVADMMTAPVRTVAPGASVAEAARLMVGGVKRLPVVDGDGKLVGIVSRADVVAVFARDDAAIAADVDEVVTAGLLPIVPGAVAAAVEDGTVVLSGSVDARSDAEILVDIVGRIDGVLAVVSELAWEVDDRAPGERFAGYPRAGADR